MNKIQVFFLEPVIFVDGERRQHPGDPVTPLIVDSNYHGSSC